MDGYDVVVSEFGPSDGRTRNILRRVIELYEAWGKPAKAAEYRARLDQ